MVAILLRIFLRLALAVRYRVKLRGIDAIARRGTGGILFLPNHPALVDPLIVISHLHARFRPRPLADRDQVNVPVIRYLARKIGVIPLPDIKVHGPAVRPEVEAAQRTCIETLKGGGNVLLYPSGHIYRTRHEDLRGNSGALELIRQVPGCRVVLVRTRGLWGSALSLAGGEYPNLGRLAPRLLAALARNYFLGLPRRRVTLEFWEPPDLPRDADRHTFNRFLEAYYNADAPPNTYVAYDFNARPAVKHLPDPQLARDPGAAAHVPPAVRERVLGHLREASGLTSIRDTDRLAHELGLDSLVRAEVLLWLAQEFGITEQDGDAVQTVSDLLLAACGQAIVTRPTPLKPPPKRWFMNPRSAERSAVATPARATSRSKRAATNPSPSQGEGRVGVSADDHAVTGDRPSPYPLPGREGSSPPRAASAATTTGDRVRLTCPPGETITAAFLAAAQRHPDRVIIADQASGARSYRDVITAILVLQPLIAELRGTHVGIMLPASVGATVVYWATLFAGKVPLLVNWTTGARNVKHALDVAGVRCVLTAGQLVARLEQQGVDLAPYREQLVLLEDLRKRVTLVAKLAALVRSYADWSPLRRARVADTAAILVTSGSESLPKLVPLSHTNVLTNIRDVLEIEPLYASDRMIGFLPPFHSFGLTVTVIAPPLMNLPVVYHTNPTEALLIARLIHAYRVSIVLGTPTFLSGILRATPDNRLLGSLRLAITGAEKCPEATYAALAAKCPQATVLEGYGITECAPIVACNTSVHTRPGTIGRVLPSVEYALVDVETDAPAAPGRQGMLLVRGPSIFGGYLGDDVASPFVTHAGQTWYRTGDLVTEDDDGVLTFRGRLKRFVKIGGEMVSLPAIEAALLPHHGQPDDEGPPLAVVATQDETRPDIVLFATRPVDRAAANQQLRAAGLSPLHNISSVRQVDTLPLLGNGKTDYRALEAQMKPV